MKKHLFLFILMLLPILASADDVKINETTLDNYVPFVELGKQWYVVSAGASPNYVCHLERYEMYENVERDGKIYAHTLI